MLGTLPKSCDTPLGLRLPVLILYLYLAQGMSSERLAILISGRGSNMIALLNAIRAGHLSAEPAVVISNVESAPGLAAAGAYGVETAVFSHKGLARHQHDERIAAELRRRGATLVCLAGYMRLIGPGFVRAYQNRILNIHPSLLPAFPGLDAQRQALEHGAKITGCTVHIVDEELDHGPIIAQRAVEVRDNDTVETLSARILEQEHQLYPQAVARVLSESFRIEGRRTYSF